MIPSDESAALILQQDGTIYRADLRSGDTEPEVFLDLEGRIAELPGYEEGLLGLAFAPDYEESGKFYVNYTAYDPRRSVISRFTVMGDIVDPDSEHVVLEVPQPHEFHNGGAMAFGPDGYLYIALGDGGPHHDPDGHGQNTDTILGSIIRIDVSTDPYGIPEDNPFAEGGGAPEIFAYGFRNPWRMTFDNETGDLWVGDVGEDRWEEINRVERGGNYGWNIMEGSRCFRSPCETDGLITPRAEYRNRRGEAECAVIGGYVYRGSRLPELNGWYIYGDFCSGRTWALDTADDTSEPIVLVDSELPIVSFLRTHDGEVYIVSHRGGIHRLNVVEPTPEPGVTEEP